MSAWTKLVGDSGVLTRLEELGPAIDRALARDDNATEDVESLERLRSVLTVIGKRLERADSDLLVHQSVNALATHIANATAHVQTFVGNGEQTALENANSLIDAALGTLATIVFPAKSELRGLRDATDSYREAMTAHLRTFETDAVGQRERIDALEAKLTEAEAVFVKTIADIQKDEEAFHASAATTREELMAAEADAEKKMADGASAALEKWETAFEAAEKTREETSKAARDEQQGHFEKLSVGFDDELTLKSQALDANLKTATLAQEASLAELKTAYQDKAQVVLTEIQNHLRSVQELVGVIGDHGVTSGFKKAADDAVKEVVYWQRVTFWSMVILILFTGYTAVAFVGSTFNILDLGRRVLFAATVGALATYAASQTARYQQSERKNRKLELELRALEPFLAPVAPEEREKFRLKIAEIFFGKDELVAPEKPGPATALHASKETVEKALDVLKAYFEKK